MRTWLAILAVVAVVPGQAAPAPVQTPASATIVGDARISPDGGVVAFTRGRPGPGREPQGLYRVPFAGGDPRLLVAPEALLSHLRWSPDGTRIAFIARGTADRAPGRVQIVTAAGTKSQPVVDAGSDVTAVEWSLDGRRLICLLDGGPTGGRARLTIVDLVSGGGGRMEFPEVVRPEAQARIAPPIIGGTTLFVDRVGADQQSLTLRNGGDTWIELLTLTTGDRVAVMPPGIATILAPPSWSADGRRFVAVGENAEHRAEVFAGTVPAAQPNRPDWVGAAPPAVRRITFPVP